MINDELGKIFDEVLSKQIEEWRAEGLLDDEIRTKLDNINFEDTFASITEKAAVDTVEFFKEHMYEIDFEEKIRTNEFLSHQESIWGKGFVWKVLGSSGSNQLSIKIFVMKYFQV